MSCGLFDFLIGWNYFSCFRRCTLPRQGAAGATQTGGAVVAGWLLPKLGVAVGTGWVREIVNAAIGGVIVLVILSFIRR